MQVTVMRTGKGHPVFEYSLPDAQRRRWADGAARIEIPDLGEEPRRHARSICDELDDRCFEDDPYIAALAAGTLLARSHLSGEILEGLHLLKEGRLPYLVIHNLPTGDVPWGQVRPPDDGRRPCWKRDWTSEMTLLGTVQAGGLEALGYFEEARGALVQDLVPADGWERAHGAADGEHASFHTDNAMHPRRYRAEGIAVLGLINDNVVRTMLAPVDDILEHLAPGQIAALSREQYALSPELFDDGQPFAHSPPLAILSHGPRGTTEINGAVLGMHPCCAPDEWREALDALRALAAALVPPVAREIVVGPNDLLLMSNITAMHALHARPGRRWLQKAYYSASLDGLRANGLTADTRLTRRFHARPALATVAF